MLTPIIMMALTGRLATAADLAVTATVPAPMPSGTPLITSIANGSSTTQSQVAVEGTCPTIDPAIIIAIYDSGTLVGSAECTIDGTFSVVVSLSVGLHTLTAVIVTITGETGASSPEVMITRILPPGGTGSVAPTPDAGFPSQGSSDGLGVPPLPLHIVQDNAYLLMGLDGSVQWAGAIKGGVAPYSMRIDWGDGKIDSFRTSDQTSQRHIHTYKNRQTYRVTVRVTDAQEAEASQQIVAVTLVPSGGALVTSKDFRGGSSSIISLLEQNILQVYILTLFSLTFLWYWEHGRHMVKSGAKKSARINHRHRHG